MSTGALEDTLKAPEAAGSHAGTLEQAINQTQQQGKAWVGMGDQGFTFRDLDGLVRLAGIYLNAGLVPKDFMFGKDANGREARLPRDIAIAKICVAIEHGHAVGLSPSQSVQSIAVINGRPTMWGDALKGLCEASPHCESIEETFEGSGDAFTAVCVAKRKGRANAVVQRFSVADAKTAKLWGKAGPWTQYPKRMLQMRARGFSLRDAFADVLKGIIPREEAEDYSLEEAGITPVPEQPAAPSQPTTSRTNQLAERFKKQPAAGELPFITPQAPEPVNDAQQPDEDSDTDRNQPPEREPGDDDPNAAGEESMFQSTLQAMSVAKTEKELNSALEWANGMSPEHNTALTQAHGKKLAEIKAKKKSGKLMDDPPEYT